MAETAQEWVKRVFKNKFHKKQVVKERGKDGKPIFENVVTDNILIQQIGGATVTVPITTFVKMFRRIIESRKNKTDLQKAEAIAAESKRGYDKFIEECKAEGMFK